MFLIENDFFATMAMGKKKNTSTLKRGEADGPKTENKIDGAQLNQLSQLEAHQEEN